MGLRPIMHYTPGVLQYIMYYYLRGPQRRAASPRPLRRDLKGDKMYSKRLNGQRFAVAAFAALIAAPMAQAQDVYPSRPVKLVVGYAPASGADVVARLIGNKLSESLKQSVIVENKPGAGGVIA